MAKKRFTDDLFDLFEEPANEGAAPAVGDTREEAVDVQVPVKTPSARRKLSSKGFTQDLDAFLSDSFEQKEREPAPARRNTPPARRRRSGLDFLIRSTVSADDEDRQPRGASPETKRVTLIFNKAHLAELKEQAKERKMYLKDVVQEMVAAYLKE